MAIDTTNVIEKIDTLRAMVQKDSISPESLGVVLQEIADALGTGVSSADLTGYRQDFQTQAAAVDSYQNAVNALSQKISGTGPVLVYFLKALPLDSETGGLRLRYTRYNIATGELDQSIENSVVIPPVSESKPGLMTSEQAETLKNLKMDIYEGGGLVADVLANTLPDMQTAINTLTQKVAHLEADMYEGGGCVPDLEHQMSAVMAYIESHR